MIDDLRIHSVIDRITSPLSRPPFRSPSIGGLLNHILEENVGLGVCIGRFVSFAKCPGPDGCCLIDGDRVTKGQAIGWRRFRTVQGIADHRKFRRGLDGQIKWTRVKAAILIKFRVRHKGQRSFCIEFSRCCLSEIVIGFFLYLVFRERGIQKNIRIIGCSIEHLNSQQI